MGRSLWGNLEELASGIKLPKEMLEEQAECLKERFDGLVRGRVLPTDLPENWKSFYKELGVTSDFSFSFRIFSDYVKRYQYEICKVTYGIKVYPVAISFETGIAEEVEEVFDLEDNDTIVIYDEEMFLSVLERILTSQEVHQVLRGLVSMAKRERESEEMPF